MNMNTLSFLTRVRLKLFDYPRETTASTRLAWRKGIDTA